MDRGNLYWRSGSKLPRFVALFISLVLSFIVIYIGFINSEESFLGFFAPSPTRHVSMSSVGYGCRSGNKCSGSVKSGFNHASSSSLCRIAGMRSWTVLTKLIGLCGNNRIAVDFLACLGIFPEVIQPGKAEYGLIFQLKITPGKRRFGEMDFIRLIEPSCRDQTALRPKRLLIDWLVLNPLVH
jgi:hypothetical protein